MDENSKNYKPEYKYIPQEALDYMAQRFSMGAKKHGAWSYKEGNLDFYMDRARHAIKHIEGWLKGDDTDPHHLAGAICDIAIVIYGEEHKEEVLMRTYDKTWTKLKDL